MARRRMMPGEKRVVVPPNFSEVIREVVIRKVMWSHVDPIPLQVVLNENPRGLARAIEAYFDDGCGLVSAPNAYCVARRREMPREQGGVPHVVRVRVAEVIISHVDHDNLDGELLAIVLRKENQGKLGQGMTNILANLSNCALPIDEMAVADESRG